MKRLTRILKLAGFCICLTVFMAIKPIEILAKEATVQMEPRM